MKLHADTKSYMQLCLNGDGQPLYLMVPTYFDSTKKEWIGFVKLPTSQKMIYGTGKTSKTLEQSFNDNLRKVFESELADEAFSLFKPLSYWSEMMEEEE